MELMIEVAGLSVVLPPDTMALDGIDLAVRAGEFVVILGRSGAGKTTFLRSINRLVDPTAGVIRVAGRAVTGASAAELRQVRRQIGMIFQQFNLVRRASVLDNVLAGRLGYVPSLPSLVGRFPAGEQRLAPECLAQGGLAHPADPRAGTPSPGPHARGHRRDLRRRRGGMRRAAVFVGAVVFAWLVWDTGADPVRLVQGLPWILDFARRTIPPDPRVLPAALAGALTTVEIALLGTAVAAALALPLGFLSARNVAPGAVFYPARAVLNFFRSVDTLVYALVFVAAVGLGPFPGVLAVVAYTTTSLAKLYSEAIEGIEPGPVDAIRATGATRLQLLRYGVLPQVLPLFLSYVLYRLETNIRAATVLGFVGAGGIGFYLQTYLRMIDYPAASTVLLVTVAMVMVVDAISSRLRDRLV